MKKLYILLSSFCLTTLVTAQTPEDALRLSWSNPSGTARYMAIGGTMIGLGGEITSAHTNPAGLGFFKNGEFVFSPGFNFNNKNKADYRGTNGTNKTADPNFNLGTSGVILAGTVDNNKKGIKSAALAISVNRLADYNNSVSYKGFNNNSSGAERYAEELVRSKLSIDDAINSPFVSVGTRLGLYTYLVDTLTIGGVKQVVAFPEFTNGVNQENTINTTGSNNELALSLAVNKNEKLFIGGSLGMPIMNYQRQSIYKETDASAVTNNGFAYYNYEENLKTTGIGFNGKLGIIYRPVEKIRLGATIHTPTLYSLNDATTATMAVKTENIAAYPTRTFANTTSVTQQVLISNGAKEIENKYTYITPWRIGIGGSYVFNEVKDVRKQKAFIAADIEYVTYKSMRFKSQEDDVIADSYYEGTNNDIKKVYRNVFNVRLGGEVKFNTIMVRLGGALFGNPNADGSILKQNRMNLSGGLGYRHKGIFIDATYIHQMNRAADVPYRLADKANTFADVRGSVGTVMLTFGTKF